MATKTPTTPKKAPARKVEAPKPSTTPKPKTPEQIIADEYGIDAGCIIIPRLLYCILCELVRGRSNG